MLEMIQNVLTLVDDYGADKLFMVWFFLLHRNSLKKLGEIQNERIEDNKTAVRALVEAKHAQKATCMKLDRNLEAIKEMKFQCYSEKKKADESESDDNDDLLNTIRD